MEPLSDHKGSHPVVPEDARCVWMSAGVLSYQVCDRGFDCDHCPLNRALHMHGLGRPGVQRPPDTSDGPASGDDCRWSRNHCWVRDIGDGTFRVGLEPMLASVLPQPKTIALPIAGTSVGRLEKMCWLIFDETILPIASPAAGKIVRSNSTILDHPGGLCTHPLTSGWLFDLKPSEPARFLTRPAALQAYNEDMTRFQSLFLESLQKGSAKVGFMQQDGGEPLFDPIAILGQRKYLELVLKALLSPG